MVVEVAEAASELDFVGHAVCHHDDERLDLALCDKVIHDKVCVTLH